MTPLTNYDQSLFSFLLTFAVFTIFSEFPPRAPPPRLIRLPFNKSNPVLAGLPSNNGTNCCAFLALKVAEAWYHKMKGTIVELNCFVRTVEDIINRIPRNVNPFRDIYRCYDVTEASKILKENSLVSTTTLKELTEVTQTFTTEGRNHLFNALRKIKDIGIMECPPYIFAVGRLAGEYFVIDMHAIDNCIGGNSNGIVIQFLNL